VGQEDEIILLPHVQGLDDRPVELLPDPSVLQPGVPQGGEEAVLIAIRHLGRGEDHVNELLPQGAGEGFFQEA